MKKVFAFGLDLEVEDWFKYLAVDSDGGVWGFSLKPNLKVDVWNPDDDDYIYDIIHYIDDPLTSVELLIVGV